MLAQYRGWNITMRNLPDHGLPLVQLKEQRRDMIVALQNRNGPISGWELIQIAAVQQATRRSRMSSPTSMRNWKRRPEHLLSLALSREEIQDSR
jgi:hypothetical protein